MPRQCWPRTALRRYGVNRLNLAWLDRADQERVLKEIADSGVTHVRLSLSRPVDKSIEAVGIASRLGLHILLEIQLSNKSYYGDAVRPRSGQERIWDINRLSDLDLDRYRLGLRDALARLDALGVRLDAVEPETRSTLPVTMATLRSIGSPACRRREPLPISKIVPHSKRA